MTETAHRPPTQAVPWDPDLPVLAIQRSGIKATPELPRGREAMRPLSPREREVAALMASGSTNREIAEALFISIATAERHASNIFNKLGVRTRTRVAVWAIETGLTLEQAN